MPQETAKSSFFIRRPLHAESDEQYSALVADTL